MSTLKANTDTKQSLQATALASLLIGARSQGHILHLQSTKFSEHIALDEFYKGIGKIADKVIEVYQGQYPVIVGYKLGPMATNTGVQSSIDYLKGLRDSIQAVRYEAVPKEWTNIHNEIDNAVSLIDQVLYKLINLK